MSSQSGLISSAGVDLHRAPVPMTKLLAENAHDLCASQRLAKGWWLGPQQDDPKKPRPRRVIYANLLETQKNYGHPGTLGTMKALFKLVDRILPTRA